MPTTVIRLAVSETCGSIRATQPMNPTLAASTEPSRTAFQLRITSTGRSATRNVAISVR